MCRYDKESSQVAKKELTIFRPTKIISLVIAVIISLYAIWALYIGKFIILPWAKNTHSLEGIAAQLASLSLLALAVFIVVMLFEWKYKNLRGLIGYIAFFSFILMAILSAFY